MYAHIQSAGSIATPNTQKLKEIYERLMVEYVDSYVKLSFDSREIPVQKGDIVGISGDSGGVPPYLHLEVRDNKDENFLNPGLYFDLGTQKTLIDISELRIGTTKYPLNAGEKPTITIDDEAVIAVHAGVKLRHNISPKVIELYLDDSLIYQIDFTLINIDHRNDAGDVYVDSSNVDYWFRLRSKSKTGVITVNRWNELDMTYPHEAKLIVVDQWGNSASRNFVLESR